MRKRGAKPPALGRHAPSGDDRLRAERGEIGEKQEVRPAAYAYTSHLAVDPEQRGRVYGYHLQRLHRRNAVVDRDTEHAVHEPVLLDELGSRAVGRHDEAVCAYPVLGDRAKELRQVRAQGAVAQHRPDPQPQTVEDLFPRYGLVVGVYAGSGHRLQARLRGAAGVAVYDLAEGLRRADAGDQGGISGRQRGPARDLGRPEHVVTPQEGLDLVQPEYRFLAGKPRLRGETRHPKVQEREVPQVAGHLREPVRAHLHEEEEIVGDDGGGTERQDAFDEADRVVENPRVKVRFYVPGRDDHARRVDDLGVRADGPLPLADIGYAAQR